MFTIIQKPGTQNKFNVLSQHPDHKEGIVNEENECMLLDTKIFTVHMVQPKTITVLGDTTLHQRIKTTQEYNKDISTALESILKNGPRSLQRALKIGEPRGWDHPI